AEKDYLLAAHELRARLGRDRFRAILDEIFLNHGIAPGPAHRLIATLPFSCILTTNYDRLLELAMPGTSVYTQFDADGLGRVRRDHRKAIVKIHGDVERADTIVLAQDDYREGLFANDAFRTFMDVMFSTRTVIFVGCSLDDWDLKLILEELNFRLKSAQGPHFALMKTRGMSSIKRDNFYRSYGIQVFGDDERDGHPDIEAFLRALPVRVAQAAPKPAVSEGEAANIRSLLEAMGQRIADENRGECVYYLGEYKAGAEIRRIATCYVPGDAAVPALEPLFGAPEGLLLAGGSIPPDVASVAASHGIQCYTRAEFIQRLANFDPYLKKLKDDYAAEEIGRYFVPLKIQEEKKGRIAETPVPLDDFIDKWLATEGRNHLSILGDFGTGKTWFCRRLASRAAESGGRVPILVLLRDYSKAYDIEQVLTDALVNRFGVELAAGFKTLQRLNDEGRLLILFDGFDEMERRVSDFKTALDNFWQIAKLVNPKAKIVLTCRTSFFRHRTEEKDVLEREGAALEVIDLKDRKEFEVVHLADFDKGQIQEALRRRAPDQWERLYERIQSLQGIDDLAHRPVLLDMITRTLPALADAEQVNLATLYDRYTTDLLERRESESITPADRRYFVEELAWEMQTQQRKSVPFHEFPQRVTARFQLKTPEEVSYFDRDIRTQTYLHRDDDGNYKFAHFSMQEFFVARRLAAMLAKGEGPEVPLTDAIARFVHFLLKDSFVYERREQDGMVYVPPGPFLFGSEGGSNLRVAHTEGYWIDRYPVTNAQFGEFLRVKGNREEGGVTWLDYERSSIRDARKADHPVTGVSWYGARAYASWAGKRLPSEEEWEKAARGIDGRRYPWGEEFSADRCNTSESKRRGTSRVGEYGEAGRSPYGNDDTAGNVWEWTDSPDSEYQVLRGGAWY
ncbi:MAG: SUMF1/EgtB/PvdO family nonheme iron enzyme, partial [Bryobacteraceae bacterium]|nr:SUMF1/EgtB/PvdO family nonheme iron enzyme [Bryobacteraceae bacterium]